jgi:hypothetical protein
MSAPRLLLVEFLSADRYSQYRSELFPFVQGFARAAGVPVRWLAFGYDPAVLPTSRYRMALAPEDTAQLLTALRETAPTHVLLNEELDAPLAAAVAEAAQAAGVSHLSVYGLSDDARTFERRRDLGAWLGAGAAAPPPGEPDGGEDPAWLVDVAAPDYRCELRNELACAIKPFVQVLGGPGCVYRRSLARNPAFAGVDLTAAHRDGGCSFCGVGADPRYPYATRPVELALRQIRAALLTCPPERFVADGRAQLALAGAAAFMGLRPLWEAILAEGLPPLELHVSCRIDELRRKAPAIEALLPRLAAAGHRLAVANMGVENFSPAENERLNKGVSEDDVFVAVALVNDWERRFERAFRFWETGGFGFILFTPWTTTADLRTNLRAAERLGLHPDSFFFVSRLQLLPGRPIARLAERDGLVTGPPGSAGGGTEPPRRRESTPPREARAAALREPMGAGGADGGRFAVGSIVAAAASADQKSQPWAQESAQAACGTAAGPAQPPVRTAELAGFDSGCIVSAHEHELPWRFREPALPALYGLFLRLRQTNARGIPPDVRLDDPDLRRLRLLRTRLPLAERSPWRLLPRALDVADEHPDLRGVGDLLERLEARLAPLLGAPDLDAVAREEREAAGPAAERRETAADRERRAALEARLGELLVLLRDHPKRLLRGFAPSAVTARATGAGWGELHVELARGEVHLGLRLLPRAAAPRGFVTTERFTLMHDEDTPADTDEKRHLLDLVARGLERYVRAREGPSDPPRP